MLLAFLVCYLLLIVFSESQGLSVSSNAVFSNRATKVRSAVKRRLETTWVDGDYSMKTIKPEFKITTASHRQIWAHGAALSDGGYIFAWQSEATSSWKIAGRRYTEDMNPGAGVVQYSDTAGRNGNTEIESFSKLGGGGYLVGWETYASGTYRTYARRYGANHQPASGSFRLGTSSRDYHVRFATFDDGGFVAVFTDRSSIFGQRYSKTNGKLGSLVTLKVSGSSHDHPHVAAWRDEGSEKNRFVVVCKVGTTIYGQRFKEGNTVGSPFKVNTVTGSYAYVVDIAVLADKKFVVGYFYRKTGALYWGSYAQMFKEDATKFNSEIKLYDETKGTHTFVSIGPTPGGFLCAWGSWEVTYWDWDVDCQFYNNAGQKKGKKWKANKSKNKNQGEPAVVAQPSGKIMIAWNSNHAGGRFLIYGTGYQLTDKKITKNPTAAPTDLPTTTTTAPVDAPTSAPTDSPTNPPTDAPSDAPTSEPTPEPTRAPHHSNFDFKEKSKHFGTVGKNFKLQISIDTDFRYSSLRIGARRAENGPLTALPKWLSFSLLKMTFEGKPPSTGSMIIVLYFPNKNGKSYAGQWVLTIDDGQALAAGGATSTMIGTILGLSALGLVILGYFYGKRRKKKEAEKVYNLLLLGKEAHALQAYSNQQGTLCKVWCGLTSTDFATVQQKIDAKKANCRQLIGSAMSLVEIARITNVPVETLMMWRAELKLLNTNAVQAQSNMVNSAVLQNINLEGDGVGGGYQPGGGGGHWRGNSETGDFGNTNFDGELDKVIEQVKFRTDRGDSRVGRDGGGTGDTGAPEGFGMTGMTGYRRDTKNSVFQTGYGGGESLSDSRSSSEGGSSSGSYTRSRTKSRYGAETNGTNNNGEARDASRSKRSKSSRSRSRSSRSRSRSDSRSRSSRSRSNSNTADANFKSTTQY